MGRLKPLLGQLNDLFHLHPDRPIGLAVLQFPYTAGLIAKVGMEHGFSQNLHLQFSDVGVTADTLVC